MAKGRTRVKLNLDGFTAVRKSPAVVAELQRRGNMVAAEATRQGARSNIKGGAKYEVAVRERAKRTVVLVSAADDDTSALNAGRVGKKKFRPYRGGRKDLLRALDAGR